MILSYDVTSGSDVTPGIKIDRYMAMLLNDANKNFALYGNIKTFSHQKHLCIDSYKIHQLLANSLKQL